MSDPICKACCGRNQPHCDTKYSGYCIQCSIAGAPEKDAEITELRALLRKARLHVGLTSVADEIDRYFEGVK